MGLCYRCGNTGRYMGNGMMMTDCELNHDEENLPKKVPIDRKSQSYQKAIKDIMALNPSISRQEAIKMFDKAYNA